VKNKANSLICAFGVLLIWLPGLLPAQAQKLTEEQKLLQVMHSIDSHTLFCYVEELASEKYAGRLTGTAGFIKSAEWVSRHFEKWGLLPAGDNDSYLQAFPIPYTLVFDDCFLHMHLPLDGDTVIKDYRYEDEFIPGSTSGSGEVTAEVVYAGYGITAPELDFDEYAGLDVEGKIVLLEREAPVDPNLEPEKFMDWRPYSFHQYKLKNAAGHGAKGMLYNYHIANPNNAYIENIVYTHVGETVVGDIFAGTGKKHADVVKTICDTLKPRSFATGKVFTLKNTTEHHPEGIGYNVLAAIPGSDIEFSDEVIMIPRHFPNIARPRLDAARFLWAGVPSISLSSFGTRSYYHVTKDNLDIMTPEVMEDLAGILFFSVLEMANQEKLNFLEGE